MLTIKRLNEGIDKKRLKPGFLVENQEGSVYIVIKVNEKYILFSFHFELWSQTIKHGHKSLDSLHKYLTDKGFREFYGEVILENTKKKV